MGYRAAVERQKTDSVFPESFHLDGRRVTDYKWTSPGVRTDGSNHEGFHAG